MPERTPPLPPAWARAVADRLAWTLPLARHAARAVSVVGGAYIEYHEVVIAQEAQWLRIMLGLWFMAVPPALWLDSFRRLALATGAVSSPSSPPPPADPEKAPSGPASGGGGSAS